MSKLPQIAVVRRRKRTCCRVTFSRGTPPNILVDRLIRVFSSCSGRPVLYNLNGALDGGDAPCVKLITSPHLTTMTLPVEPLNCTVTDTLAPLWMACALPLNALRSALEAMGKLKLLLPTV